MHQTGTSSQPRNPRIKRAFGANEALIHEFGISRLYRWVAAGTYALLMIVTGTAFYASWEVLANSRTLAEGTTVITLHLLPLATAAALTVVATGVIALYFLWYLRAAHAYALTDQRIIIHIGWLSTRYVSINYGEITDVKVKIGIVERFLFGTGTLYVNTAGADGFEVVVRHIDDPYMIKREIFSMIEEG